MLIPFGFALSFQAAYDKICAAKVQAAERTRKLDGKRKKFKFGELSVTYTKKVFNE